MWKPIGREDKVEKTKEKEKKKTVMRCDNDCAVLYYEMLACDLYL